MLKKLIQVLLWIWQLPQNLIAFFIINFIYTDKNSYCYHVSYKGVHFFPTIVRSCFMDNFSLGDYIFISSSDWLDKEKNIRRSYGFVLTSRLFGPLWIFAIAIPRFIYAYYNPMSYYLVGHYTEKLANKLSLKKKKP